MSRLFRALALALLAALSLAALLERAGATQRSPAWWDPDGVGSGSDWHYRVPVTLPAASSVNSTAKVDIDFAALMTQLGIAGTFDASSIRVVRPGGTIATTQEFTDTIYAGATDSSGNLKGEVRWIVQDGGAQTYYIYFDVTQNGLKSANPQTPINGNFERGSTGTAQPAGWNAPVKASANFDAQVRPNETISVSNDQAPADGVNPRSTNGTSKTGAYSYLIGWRSSAAAVEVGTPGASFSRTFTVPATNPGNLVFRWKPEGWDAEAFDYLTVTITGATTTTVVTGMSGNYTTLPAAPNYGNVGASTTSPGFRQYNGFDCDLAGNHRFGMTTPCHSEPWFTATQSLAAYAGQTVTITFTATQDNQDKTWYLIDDIEWSVVSGTLGSAEGFGVAVTSPQFSQPPGKVLTIAATVDAKPTAATNPVTGEVINAAGTTVASGIKLFNDGTHGDAAANDAIWTNNGSDGANPTYTVPLSNGSTSGWKVRVLARDSSSSTQGQNGMVHRNGQGTTLMLANWWNIDEGSFDVDAAAIGVTKSMTVHSDGVNSAYFKAIPGAQVTYCVTIGNTGTAAAGTVTATDSLPATLTFVPGSIASGADCASAATAEDDNTAGSDESDPIGASYSAGTVTIVRPSLPLATSFAVTYRATIN